MFLPYLFYSISHYLYHVVRASTDIEMTQEG